MREIHGSLSLLIIGLLPRLLCLRIKWVEKYISRERINLLPSCLHKYLWNVWKEEEKSLCRTRGRANPKNETWITGPKALGEYDQKQERKKKGVKCVTGMSEDSKSTDRTQHKLIERMTESKQRREARKWDGCRFSHTLCFRFNLFSREIDHHQMYTCKSRDQMSRGMKGNPNTRQVSGMKTVSTETTTRSSWIEGEKSLKEWVLIWSLSHSQSLRLNCLLPDLYSLYKYNESIHSILGLIRCLKCEGERERKNDKSNARGQ